MITNVVATSEGQIRLDLVEMVANFPFMLTSMATSSVSFAVGELAHFEHRCEELNHIVLARIEN